MNDPTDMLCNRFRDTFNRLIEEEDIEGAMETAEALMILAVSAAASVDRVEATDHTIWILAQIDNLEWVSPRTKEFERAT